jgi:arginine decarboxylase
MPGWTVQDSADLYGISHWGREFVSVGADGHLRVGPVDGALPPVDLKVLTDDLRERGIDLPILLRFPDVLGARIDKLAGAFSTAIEEYGYNGAYRGVYPVKVNQQRHLLEQVVRYCRPHHMGLECGSKPELLVVMAMLEDPEALVVCNGYKDEEYIETAMLAGRLGTKTVVVIEKASELDLCISISKRLGLKPCIGFRAKLASRGSGRWKASTGDRAKFGLTIEEMVAGVDKLEAAGMLDCLQLLHFHIGSQVSAIRSFKDALKEGARIYVELARMGAAMGYFDAGGGLGVDYDGSSTDFASSMNYTVQEYAEDVVGAIASACDHNGLPHPHIVTESGRALVAHHAALVVNVLGATSPPTAGPPQAPAEDDPEVLHELHEALSYCNRKGYQAAWHDAQALRTQALNMFNLGLLDLRQRARVERLYWQVIGRISKVIEDIPYVPDDLERLHRALADTYFCNFSVFQSMPDAWAVDQLFPIVPVHRLDERPSRTAVLADITCDSDGKIDRFIDLHDVRDTLPLHPLQDGEPYLLAAFLVGAYQEILGDLHNLFGDTNVVVVNLQADGSYELDQVLEGDTVSDVLRYVHYDRKEMVARLRRACERAVRRGSLSLAESRLFMKNYIAGLEGYTYLE